jgi:hypothetical protein
MPGARLLATPSSPRGCRAGEPIISRTVRVPVPDEGARVGAEGEGEDRDAGESRRPSPGGATSGAGRPQRCRWPR